jgi:hypothetical protein
MEMNDPKIVWMSKSDILKQHGFVQMHHNRWFLTHPETGDLLFYQTETKRRNQLRGASPMCNSNKDIAIHIKNTQCPWANVDFFEVVACPIFIEDYS